MFLPMIVAALFRNLPASAPLRIVGASSPCSSASGTSAYPAGAGSVRIPHATLTMRERFGGTQEKYSAGKSHLDLGPANDAAPGPGFLYEARPGGGGVVVTVSARTQASRSSALGRSRAKSSPLGHASRAASRSAPRQSRSASVRAA